MSAAATGGAAPAAVSARLAPGEVLRLYPPHDGTLRGLLASRAARAPARPCLEYRDQVIGYGELLAQVDHARATFVAHGVRRGDRVAVLSPNHPATVVALLALASLGALMVGVNPEFGPSDVRWVVEHSACCGLICAASTLPVAQAAWHEADPAARRPWVWCNEANAAGLPVFPGEPGVGAAAGGAGGAATGAAADASADASADAPPIDGEAPCIVVYTSGTTGRPKGVVHRQASLVLAGEGFVQRLHLQPQERMLCILPMFHINAVFYSLMGALAAGATLLLEERFSAGSFWRTVATRRATQVNTIAAVLGILMRRPRHEFVPGHGLRTVYGAPIPPEAYAVFSGEFGVPVLIEGYGMSEIPGVASNPVEGPIRPGSMGLPSRHPEPGVTLAELRVVDEAGQDLPPGQAGELVVRTPTIMLGYFADPSATESAFLPAQGLGIGPAELRHRWFRTGDRVRLDAEGFLWFIARQKDVIRRRGENIAGAEIDAVALQHPEVVEAAAIGVPAELGEDEVLLLVVRREGSTLSEAALAQWCRDRLAAFKQPRYLLFVTELPRTPTHRVAKFELRREAAALRARAVDLGAS